MIRHWEESSHRQWWSITTWSTLHQLCPTINSPTQNYSCCCWYDRSVDENTQWCYLHSLHIHILHTSLQISPLKHHISMQTQDTFLLRNRTDLLLLWHECIVVTMTGVHRLSLVCHYCHCSRVCSVCSRVWVCAVTGGCRLSVESVLSSNVWSSVEYGECVSHHCSGATIQAFTPHTPASSSSWLPAGWPCCRPCGACSRPCSVQDKMNGMVGNKSWETIRDQCLTWFTHMGLFRQTPTTTMTPEQIYGSHPKSWLFRPEYLSQFLNEKLARYEAEQITNIRNPNLDLFSLITLISVSLFVLINREWIKSWIWEIYDGKTDAK